MVGQEHLEMKRHWKFRHLLMVREKGWWKKGQKGHMGAGCLMRNSRGTVITDVDMMGRHGSKVISELQPGQPGG